MPSFLLPNAATERAPLPLDPQVSLDPFSGLGNGSLLSSSKQSALSLFLLFNAALAPSLAISPPATFKSLSSPNIVPFPTLAEQTAFVLLPLSNPSMTSLLLA